MPDNSRDLLLATKLHIPRLRTQLVSRSLLIERLQQGMEYALTLVSAPAGFGKTTLLTQWVAESGTPVSWLSLEPERFTCFNPTQSFSFCEMIWL